MTNIRIGFHMLRTMNRVIPFLLLGLLLGGCNQEPQDSDKEAVPIEEPK